jgi:hypothetical protein
MEVDISCCIQGESFSPLAAQKISDLPLSEQCEVGQLGKVGRFQGKPIPYGACVLRFAEMNSLPYGPRLEQMIGSLEKNIDSLRKCGAQDFILRLVVSYKTQCNLEFSPLEMIKLAVMGIQFTISCYVSDN